MSGFTPAPMVRPRPNIGGLLDIPCGRYHVGKYGDSILNGGFSNFIGWGGRGNTFKTLLSQSISLIVLNRYEETSMVMYDTEITASWDRLEDLTSRYPNINWEQALESGRIILTSAGEHSGNEWWKMVREDSASRAKAFKQLARETPFLGMNGKPIMAIPLRIMFLDSMSQLETEAIAEIYEKNEIDAGAANTDALRGAAIKTRLCMQVPAVTTSGFLSLIATAHVGDETKLDPYAPAKQQLAFLKKGLKFKNCPEKFTFLTSNTWVVMEATSLLNQSTKAPEYPKAGYNDATGDTDLMELAVINVRSKSGPTGHIFKLVVSQTEGFLPHLTEFHYLKDRKDKFGLLGPEGVSKSYRLALYPDKLLQRTKVRDMIDEDPRLQRALEITSELAQIQAYWVDFPREELPDPADLYKRLKEMGYDWDLLLDTRGYWTYDHYSKGDHPLSTMDLINMYHGRYVPFWYPEKDKIKPLAAGESSNANASETKPSE